MTRHPILTLRHWSPDMVIATAFFVGVLATLWIVVSRDVRRNNACEQRNGVWLSRGGVCLRKDITVQVPP